MLPWVTDVANLAAGERPAVLTDHYYPLTSCGGHTPKLSYIVSPLTRRAETVTLKRLAAIAQASALPLRIDETNNISCRGQPGVSDVFDSALWAVDYVARAMAVGVAGLNFHDLIGEPRTYSPLAAGDAAELAGGALHANPEWYALLLARHLLGDQAGASATRRPANRSPDRGRVPQLGREPAHRARQLRGDHGEAVDRAPTRAAAFRRRPDPAADGALAAREAGRVARRPAGVRGRQRGATARRCRACPVSPVHCS